MNAGKTLAARTVTGVVAGMVLVTAAATAVPTNAERCRRYRQAHLSERQEAERLRSRQRREADPEGIREYHRQYRQANPEKAQEHQRRKRDKLRTAVFDHYGWQCPCCGTTERPTIDHINGDGAEHRSQPGIRGGGLYRWLIQQGFPEGFQTLCVSCNLSKKTGERCRLNHEGRPA